MNMKKKDPESTEMTFFEHIDALRPHLVRGVMAIGVIGLVAFFCKSFIIDTVLFNKEGKPESPDAGQDGKLRLEGSHNLLLLVGVVGGGA